MQNEMLPVLLSIFLPHWSCFHFLTIDLELILMFIITHNSWQYVSMTIRKREVIP